LSLTAGTFHEWLRHPDTKSDLLKKVMNMINDPASLAESRQEVSSLYRQRRRFNYVAAHTPKNRAIRWFCFSGRDMACGASEAGAANFARVGKTSERSEAHTKTFE
jgi:hypothetical protein